MTRASIHFVTGRLAEHSLRPMLASLADDAGFDYTIDVLPITVAALMTPVWISRHIRVAENSTQVLIPGYCEGDLEPVESVAGVPVMRGPRDLLQLPEFLAAPARRRGVRPLRHPGSGRNKPRLQTERGRGVGAGPPAA